MPIDPLGDSVATSAADGTYLIQGIKPGAQILKLSAQDFRYVSLPSGEFQPINESTSVIINGNEQPNFGLMQGFLTLPFKGNYPIDRMYDHAPGKEILWWNGVHVCPPSDKICYAVPPGTNEHPGIDYKMQEGTEILAAAPGKVRQVDEKCGGVIITLPVETDGRPFFTQYNHLSEIKVREGDTVVRGQQIGLAGSKCTPYTHLHFGLLSAPNNTDFWAYIDPYKPIVDVPEGFWLSGDLLPSWTTEYHPANNKGWWTVENNPQNP
jgi:murein DD-endopeptidase MepM/ murein hydrolase activator NlpD